MCGVVLVLCVNIFFGKDKYHEYAEDIPEESQKKVREILKSINSNVLKNHLHTVQVRLVQICHLL